MLFWDNLNPWRMVCNLWSHRELIAQITRRDLQGRYRGSFLGLFWTFFTPLLMLIVYTFIFSVILKSRFPDSPVGDSFAAHADFSLKLFCGLIVFQIFSETIIATPGVILGNTNFVKKVVFPLEILPLATLLTSLFHAAISLGILLLGITIINRHFTWTMLYFPLMAAPMIFMALGFGWMLASLGVFIRDIGHAMVIVSNLLFFMTPIFYQLSNLSVKLQAVLYLNPLTTIVLNTRGVMMQGQTPQWGAMAIIAIFSMIVLQAGYAWFMKTKKWFPDVI